MNRTVRSREEMQQLAESLGRLLQGGDVVALSGPLGAGKTTFVGGLARGVGIFPEYPVTSPTFVYAHIYEGKMRLHHLDLFRIEDPSVLHELGITDLLGGEGASVVEWFEKFPETWTGEMVFVTIAFLEGDTRTLSAEGRGDRGKKLVADWDKTA